MALFTTTINTVTSIRFTATDITVVKIDVPNKKIVTLYQQALPPGIMVRGEIATVPQAIPIVKNVLIQAQCLGEEVVIGFPEDRTLLGNADVTNIPKEKMAEAIGWQISEIFPTQSDTLYVDWQLIGSSTQALLLAGPRSVIDGYVNTLIQSGAKPVSCEPTSVSLAKLVPLGELSVVAEIRKTDSTAAIIDANQTVRLSTIIPDPTQLVNQIHRMLDFYEQKYGQKAGCIYLCGEGATKDWLAFVNSQTKVTTKELPLPLLLNLPTNPLRFAVSLGLSSTLPLPSKHPSTINLLPTKLEKEYEQQVEKKQLSFGFKTSIVATIITSIIMIAALIQIKISVASLKTQITAQEQAVSQDGFDRLAKEAENANALARLIQQLPPKDHLFNVVSELNKAVPPEVTLKAYTIDVPQKVVLVNGFAPTRDLLLKFKSNLETSPVFNVVTIPLPTLEHKKDVEFSIAIDIPAQK